MSTLKRICQCLSIPADEIIFGDQGKNDAAYLVQRLERLDEKQFAAVRDFLNQVFLLYARADDQDGT